MMSVAVMQSSSAAVFDSDKCSRAAPVDRYRRQDDPPLAVEESHAQERPGQFDIWSAIQSREAAAAAADQPAAPYVHPLARRSSSLLSQKSLEICTESLGSETGSDGFSSFMDDLDFHHPSKLDGEETEEEKKDVPFEKQAAGGGARELALVSSHCSVGRRSPPRSFPPPLPSISKRNVPCLHMRPHRLDGRLVMEAVAVPSKNYLHAQRVDGRLVLSFTGTTSGDKPGHASDATEITQPQMPEDVEQDNEDTVGNETTEITQLEEQEEEEEEEELEETNRYEDEEEEEEVEVVDRGTIVEVKVSTQPQQQSGAMKVHRSSLVINKFVGGAPLTSMTKCEQPVPSTVLPRRASPTTTTAAAAASTLSVTTEGYNDYGYSGLWAPLGGHHPPLDNKLLFTSKRRNRGELLHYMRRCSQLRRPLFIREPCCAVTST